MSIIKVTAHGGFHNSEAVSAFVKGGKLTTGQYKKLYKHFCGIKECICGGVARATIEGINRDDFKGMVETASYAVYAISSR